MKGLNSLTPSSIHDGHQPQSSELSPPLWRDSAPSRSSDPLGGTATGHGAQSPSGRDSHWPWSPVLGEGWASSWSSVPRGGWPSATGSVPQGGTAPATEPSPGGTATGHGAQSPAGTPPAMESLRPPSGVDRATGNGSPAPGRILPRQEPNPCPEGYYYRQYQSSWRLPTRVKLRRSHSTSLIQSSGRTPPRSCNPGRLPTSHELNSR